MLSTEYIRYIKENDQELLENTVRSDKRIKQMLNDEKKLYRIIDIDLKERYKSIRAYLKGINKRIGHVNDLKDHKTIVNKTEIEFNIAENIIKETKKDNMYDFILGKELSTYYIHTMYAATIIENIIDKTTFKKEIKRYIKGAMTRINKVLLSVESEIKKRHDEVLKEWDSLPKQVKVKYLLVKQCELEGIVSDKAHKSIWGEYEKEISNYNDDQLMNEYESTLYLINKAS